MLGQFQGPFDKELGLDKLMWNMFSICSLSYCMILKLYVYCNFSLLSNFDQFNPVTCFNVSQGQAPALHKLDLHAIQLDQGGERETFLLHRQAQKPRVQANLYPVSWGQHFIKYTVRSSFVRTVFQQTLAGTVNEIIKEQCSNKPLLEQCLKL